MMEGFSTSSMVLPRSHSDRRLRRGLHLWRLRTITTCRTPWNSCDSTSGLRRTSIHERMQTPSLVAPADIDACSGVDYLSFTLQRLCRPCTTGQPYGVLKAVCGWLQATGRVNSRSRCEETRVGETRSISSKTRASTIISGAVRYSSCSSDVHGLANRTPR